MTLIVHWLLPTTSTIVARSYESRKRLNITYEDFVHFALNQKNAHHAHLKRAEPKPRHIFLFPIKHIVSFIDRIERQAIPAPHFGVE